MKRIYLTNLPEPIIAAYQKLTDDYNAVFEIWFAWGRKALGYSDFRLYAGNSLVGLVPGNSKIMPPGWSVKAGTIAIYPTFNGQKELHRELKKLPRKPGWFEFGQISGLSSRMNGNNYLYPTVEKLGDQYVLAMPVDSDGAHDPIPEGAIELTGTAYLELVKNNPSKENEAE